MGKIKRVTMISAVAFLLAACSGEQDSAPQPPASPVAESASPSSDEGSATPAEAEANQPGIAIQSASRTDLRNFGTFTYMTGATTGLSPDAAAAADERIAGMVDAAVRAAVLSDDGECLEGEPQCGYFVQTLTPLPCIEPYLCVKQEVTFAGVGMAISDPSVEVLVIDPTTGRTVGIDDVVGEPSRRAFLDAVNAEVTSVQKSEEVFTDLDRPDFSEGDFAASAPLADGIHVWFPKYTAGPGFLGIVEVAVSYPSAQDANQSEADTGSVDTPVVTPRELRARAKSLCRAQGFTAELHQVTVVKEDFTGDGATDGIIGFSCVPEMESEYAGYVYHWTSDPTAKMSEGEVLDNLDAILIDSLEANGSDLTIRAQTWDGTTIATLYWTDGRWNASNVDTQTSGFEDAPASDSYTDDLPPAPAPRPAAPAPAAPRPVAPPAPTSAAVPSVVGLPAATAQSILQAAGFRMSPAAPMGSSAYIKTQSPPAGTQMALGSTVSVFFAF